MDSASASTGTRNGSRFFLVAFFVARFFLELAFFAGFFSVIGRPF